MSEEDGGLSNMATSGSTVVFSLPFSIVDNLRDAEPGCLTKFRAKDPEDNRLDILGQHVEGTFTLIISGFQSFEASHVIMCHVRDVCSDDKDPASSSDRVFQSDTTCIGPSVVDSVTSKPAQVVSDDIQIKVEASSEHPTDIEGKDEPCSEKSESAQKRSPAPVEKKIQNERRKSPESSSVDAEKTSSPVALSSKRLQKRVKFDGFVTSGSNIRKKASAKQQTSKVDQEGENACDSKIAGDSKNAHDLNVETNSDSAQNKVLIKIDLECNVCEAFTARSKYGLEKHLRVKHGLSHKQYSKSKTDSTTDPTQEHSTLATAFTCKICDSKFLRQAGFLKHIKARHQMDFTQYSEKFDEDVQKSAENPGHCRMCWARYTRLTDLIRHTNKHHATHPKRDEQIIAINEHRLSNASSKDPGYRVNCPYCNKEYAGYRVMTHLKLVHRSEADYMDMYQLAMKSVRKAQYDNWKGPIEKRVYQPDTSERSVCPYCAKRVKVRSMSRHISDACDLAPEKKKPREYSCTRCDFKCNELSEWKQHKANVHSDLFVCDICSRTFETLSGMQHHVRYKHGIQYKKPLTYRICPICDKKFEVKSSYDRHMKLVHPENDASVYLTCDLCGARVRGKQGLTKHKKAIHQGRYTYHCKDCGHGMNKRQTFLQHRCGHTRRRKRTPGNSIEGQGTSQDNTLVKDRSALGELTSVVVKEEVETLVVPSGSDAVISLESVGGNLYLKVNDRAAGDNEETGAGSSESSAAVEYICQYYPQ